MRELLALLLAALPISGWGARVSLPQVQLAPARVAPLSLPDLSAPAFGFACLPSWQASAPGLAAPALPQSPSSLSVSALPPVAAAPSVSLPLSPLQVLSQADSWSAPALKAAAPEQSAGAAGSVFDQAGEPRASVQTAVAPEVAGITRSWGRLYLKGRELEALGEGSFGRVYAHPRAPGAIIKLMTSLSGDLARESAEQDSRVGTVLAQAGVGPAVLGVSEIPGEPGVLRRWLWRLLGLEARAPPRPVVVKERVFGRNLDDMIEARDFTPRDYELVMRMLERMADARIRVGDLRPANVMIGSTASDPEPRAYLVDGGWLLPVRREETREALLRSLKLHQAELLGAGGSAGWANVQDPFDDLLRAGLSRSRQG